MDIEARLQAIEDKQNMIISLLTKNTLPFTRSMTLKEAAGYVGFSPDHFRRLAVEQRIIPFSRPSGQQKGKLLFQKSDLDNFLQESLKAKQQVTRAGRKRKSTNIDLW